MPSRWRRFDRTLKRIADEEPTGLLEWLAEVLSIPGPVTLIDARLSKELVDAVWEVDVVWRVEAAGKTFLLHLEFQLKKEDQTRPEMGERVAGYIMRLYEREHLPVTSVVIYLQRVGQLPSPPFLIPSGLGNKATMRCEYEVIKMWELPPETVLTRPYPALWPLAGMMQGMTPDAVVGVAQKIAETSLAREQQSEFIGQLVVLAGVQLAEEKIRQALRRHPMIDELWNASSVAQALREEGRKVGKVEGRAEGLRLAARLGLEHRFGALNADLLQALDTADEPTLTGIIIYAEESLEQVRARLGLAGSPQ